MTSKIDFPANALWFALMNLFYLPVLLPGGWTEDAWAWKRVGDKDGSPFDVMPINKNCEKMSAYAPFCLDV